MSFYNNKYTKWIMGALVLMNLVLLLVLFTRSSNPNHGGEKKNHEQRVERFLQKELNLTEDQAVKFKELRKAHFEKSRVHFKAIRSLKKEMLEAVSAVSPDTLQAQNLADQIGKQEAVREKLLLNHYLELQAECTPEQRQKLKSVFKRAMQRPKFRKGKRSKKKQEAN